MGKGVDKEGGGGIKEDKGKYKGETHGIKTPTDRERNTCQCCNETQD